MSTAREHDPFAPDRPAQRAILLFAIASGLMLLLAHEAIEARAAWLDSRVTRLLWCTLATLPPLMAALTVQRLADRRFIAGFLGYTALLVYLTRYAGRAIAPEAVEAGAVIFPLGWVLIASGHVLAAWFSVWLTRTDFSYPRLFDAAWRHLATLLQVLAYTGAFWLLLSLWGALFRALGIDFFSDLFRTARFAYPVTSLVAGYGLVLARTRSSIGDAVHLRMLALWRGLLPMVAVLALAFAAALLVQGVQPLWGTRHATQLLLALVVALVAFSNAAYGKGGEPPPHPALRRLVQAALLLLPLFVGLAAWALALRWRQYGLSLDRLWAALSIAIAGLYAIGYALAAARRREPWLAGIAPVNRVASVFTATALLLTQTGLLDFRAITAHTLLARGDALKDEDLRYLRWELGSPGLTALEKLQAQRQAAQPNSAAAIGQLLAQKQRYEHQTTISTAGKTPQTYQQAPGSASPPEALAAVLQQQPGEWLGRDALDQVGASAPWLIERDLDGEAPDEWLRVTLDADRPGDARASVDPKPCCESGRVVVEIFQLETTDWRRVAVEQKWLQAGPFRAFEAALQAGQISTSPPRFQDLTIGQQTFGFRRE